MMGFTGFKLMDQLTEAMTIATTAAMCLSTRAHDDFASTTPVPCSDCWITTISLFTPSTFYNCR